MSRKENEVVDVEEVKEVEEQEGLLPQGNYVVEVITNDKVSRKFVITESTLKVSRLKDGGIIVDL